MCGIYLSAKVLCKLRNEEIPSLPKTGAKWMSWNATFSRHLLHRASGIVQEFSGSVGFDEGFQCLEPRMALQ